jgi:oleate hydratase
MVTTSRQLADEEGDHPRPDRSNTKVYLVGGGIASLAAAAFLIRDAGVSGQNITILEELDRLGGSLDGSGSAKDGYLVRGGRMMESKYQCTYDLFSSIPTLDKSQTVTQEILQWNEVLKTGSKSRLVRHGHKIDGPDFGLAERHILTLERLALEPEERLGRSSIEDHFDAAFFETNFWLMWCTTFAFQPWHSAAEFKRYLVRFVHMVDGFNRLKGIMRTYYNQYDSLVRPLKAWLDERGVSTIFGAKVTDVNFSKSSGGKSVESIVVNVGGRTDEIAIGTEDYVIVTLGSMTDSSSVGTNATAAMLNGKREGSAWELWEKIADGKPEFGNPSAFDDHIDDSKWLSFTTTQRDPAFFDIVRNFTGNVPGEGGLITFADSSWLMSIVLPHQPHFTGQPEGVNVFWGYGLYVDKRGDFVDKPMAACSGAELLTEVLGHLGIGSEAARILESSTTIPCMMPFITSQFLRREKGDRPNPVPEGWRRLGFVGQFVELPDDVVFTVEYSIRSAQSVVAKLFDLDCGPPSVYKGEFDPRVLFRAFTALHDFHI